MRRGDGRAAGASARTVQEVELRAHVRARAAGRASRAARAAATHPVRQAERLHDKKKTGARANGRLRARGRRGKKRRRRVRRVASNATKGPRASSPRRVLGGFARAGTSRREKAIGRTTVRGKISSSGIPTTGDAARVDDAARRRATDPRHAGYRHPREPRGRVRRGYRSADGREPCDRGGTAGRRRGPETSSSGWDPRRRRARWWRAAVARARRRCRRSHEREWTPSGMPCAKCSSCRWSSAMDVLPIVGGKARGFEQSEHTLPQDRRENHSQLFYYWIPIRKIFPPNHRVLRHQRRAPNCPVLSDVSAVGGATLVSSQHVMACILFHRLAFASRGGHPPHATPGAAFISADAGDARRRPGGCTVGDRGIVTRVVRAPRSRRV